MAKSFKASQSFKTVTDLSNAVKLKLEAVQEMVLNEMYEHLLDIVDDCEKQIKANRNQRNMYERSRVDDRYHVPKRYGKHLLKKIWEIENVNAKGGSVYGRINRDSEEFAKAQNPFTWEYESPIYTHIDVDDFINIIQNGVSEEHSCFGEQEPVPFWNEFKIWAQKNYGKIFDKWCRIYGLPLKNMYSSSVVNKAGTIVNNPTSTSTSTQTVTIRHNYNY